MKHLKKKDFPAKLLNREAAEKAAKEEERKRVEEAKAKLAAKAEKRKKK